MPVPVSRLMKLGTPRLDLPTGDYPAIIVAMVYPKETNGACNRTRGEYLLQVHNKEGMVCYVATKPFDISINESSPLYTLLCGLSNTHSPEQLFSWLERNDYFVDDMFDETAFLGAPVMAHVERREKRKPNVPGPVKFYNLVTEFAPIDESREPTLNTGRLIPAGFGNNAKYVIEKLDELEVDEA